MAVDEKQQLEHQIVSARDGVSERIDELDRALREKLDVKSAISANAPAIIGGGAAVGFLVGFGFPKALKRLIGIGVPLALIAYKVKQGSESGT